MASEKPATLWLCRSEDLPPGAARGFQPEGHRSLFALRTATGLYAYRNRCPHAGFELNWLPDRFLDRSGQYLHCQTHGALFDRESGRCLAGPCAGARLEPIVVLEHSGSIYCQLPSER